MKKITIFSHQGLGDLILCNAIVRNYAKNYEIVYVITPENNFKSIQTMYRDLKNINVIYIDWSELHNIFSNDLLINKVLEKHNILESKLLKLGFNNIVEPFDLTFYRQSNIDITKKWSDFYFERDLIKEKDVFYNILNLKDDDKFIFVHDDYTRGYKINEKYLNNNIKIIKPDNKSISIFDFIYTIEKAQEIHCMNSSFLCLIDTILIKNHNLYYHKYVRGNGADPILKLDWKIIN